MLDLSCKVVHGFVVSGSPAGGGVGKRERDDLNGRLVCLSTALTARRRPPGHRGFHSDGGHREAAIRKRAVGDYPPWEPREALGRGTYAESRMGRTA